MQRILTAAALRRAVTAAGGHASASAAAGCNLSTATLARPSQRRLSSLALSLPSAAVAAPVAALSCTAAAASRGLHSSARPCAVLDAQTHQAAAAWNLAARLGDLGEISSSVRRGAWGRWVARPRDERPTRAHRTRLAPLRLALRLTSQIKSQSSKLGSPHSRRTPFRTVSSAWPRLLCESERTVRVVGPAQVEAHPWCVPMWSSSCRHLRAQTCAQQRGRWTEC